MSTAYDSMFERYERQYGLPVGTLRTLASIESDFNPRAMGPRTKYGHALGMFQILPSTAADYGVTNAEDLYDAEKAGDVAARHFKRLLDKFGGNRDLAFAAYNAGEGNVAKHGGVPPFRETQDYVAKAKERFGEPDPTTGPIPTAQPVESGPIASRPGVNAPSTLDRLLQRVFPATKIPQPEVGKATQLPPQAFEAFQAKAKKPYDGSVPRQAMEALQRGTLAKQPSPSRIAGSPLDPAVINAKIEAGALPAMTGPRMKGTRAPGTTVPFEERFDQGPFQNPERSFAASYPAKVVEVYDGDTLLVEFPNGQQEKVRFHDVNTAETGTEQGEVAKIILHNLLDEGDNVVVETDGDRDPYGRITGRVMFNDKQGNNIDLSMPIKAGDGRAYPAGDPLLGTGDDVTGITSHVTTPLIMMAAEVPELTNMAWRLLTPKKFEAALAENPILSGMESWERRSMEHWARYLASGYDVDATEVNIPLLGKVTLGELGRGLFSFIPYMVGISGVAGRTIKAAGASVDGARAMAMGLDKAGAHMSKRQMARSQKIMRKRVLRGETTMDAYHQWQTAVKDIDETMRKYMVTVEPSATPRTAMQLLSDFRKGFLSSWSNKYHPMMDLVKRMDPERAPEMKALLQRTLGSHDIAQSGIMGGGRISMTKQADGTYKFGRKGKDLTQVLRGLDELGAMHISAYSAAARLTGDLLPKWNQYKRALKLMNGNKQAALNYLDIKRVPIEVKDEVAKEMKEVMTSIRALYDSAGMVDPAMRGGWAKHMEPRVRAFTQWFDDNAIQPLIEVGAIDPLSYARMKAAGEHYTPFHRIVLEGLEEIAGPEAVEEILRVEKDIANKLVEAARGKNISEVSVGVRPIANLHKALGTEWDEMILDPIQTALSRIPSIQKWAEAQRVRNMLSEILDEAFEKGDDLARGFVRITDPDQIKKIQNARDGNGWIGYRIEPVMDPKTGAQKMERVGKKLGGVRGKGGRFEKGFVGGDMVPVTKVVKTGYLTNDPRMAEALRSLSSTHLSLFQNLLKNPAWRWLSGPTKLFRTGTVLGFEFMVRNPIRDQMMAAVMSRYGYVPVLDFWRGLFDVLGKTDVYKEYYNAGMGQANWINQDFEHAAKRIQDLIGDEPFTEKVNRLMRESKMSYSQALGKTLREGAGKNIRASYQMGKRAALDDALMGVRTGKGLSTAASDIVKVTKGGANSVLYSLRRFSELAEEATRVGAVGRGMRRAKKGKGVTWARSWDDAMGGAGGWVRFLTGKQKRNFRQIRAEAKTLRNTPADWMGLLDEGREITLDFARRGSTGEIMNGLFPFFNAELQDVSRFYRAMEDAPLTTMLRAFTYITVPAIANWYRNYDDPAWQAQKEIEKELFLHPFGIDEATGKFKRMPKPIGVVNEMFGNVPAKMLDFLAANAPDAIKTLEDMLWPGDNARLAREKFLEQPYEIAERIPDSVKKAIAIASMGYMQAPGDPHIERRMQHGGNPLSKMNYGGGTDALGTMAELGKHVLGHSAEWAGTNTPLRMTPLGGGQMVQNLMPQALAPLANLAWNEDPFFKSSIVPQHMMGSNALVPEETKTEATSPIEEMMASIARSIPGIEMDPIQMGYLIRRYSSSVGVTLLSGLDEILQRTGVFERRPNVPMDVTSAPVTKAFYGREPYGSNSQPVEAFYDEWEQARKRLNTMNRFKKEKDGPGAIEFLKKYPETFPDYILERGSEDISEMWEYRRRVKRSKFRPDGTVLPPEVRMDVLTTIDRAITAHAYLILEEYNKLRRDPDYMREVYERVTGYGE